MPDLDVVGDRVPLGSGHRCGRVRLRPLRAADRVPLLAAMRRTAHLIAPWNHVMLDDDAFYSVLQRSEFGGQPMFVAVDRATGGLAGKVTVYNVLRGSSQSATVGYDAFLPYAGTGRMTEALRLVVDTCFAAEPNGLDLHRLEINIGPANLRSIALATGLGFREEGRSPRFQLLGGRWRDCVRFALTSEEWPALSCCAGQAGTAARAGGVRCPTVGPGPRPAVAALTGQ